MNFESIMKDCKARYREFAVPIVADRKPKSFEEAIESCNGNAIIAEIKPASPSRALRRVSDPVSLAEQIMSGGACGISVLTEEKYFGGSLENLRKASEISRVPVLRKDFLFHESQIRETYYYGADSPLIISIFFSPHELEKFIGLSRALGMEPMVEIHSRGDAYKAQKAGARIFVINNRDKDTMKVDLNRSRELSKGLRGLRVSASGIESIEDLEFVLEHCDAALIGSAIMLEENVEEKVREFVHGHR